ncbi:hypothetical protein FACS189476_02690 [Spirochaetia bacterium]|nr:hypothetical protein FACS189476_02690 [Spirochaetia bacterium]
MKRTFIFVYVSLCISLSLFSQSGGSVAWDKGEREMLMGLTLFVRPNVVDLGFTVNDFFYQTDRGYAVESPVKKGKGTYTIRCIVGSEYNDEKVYLTFDIVRISENAALIPSIKIEGIRASTGRWGQTIASTFEEKMFVLMSYFRQ